MAALFVYWLVQGILRMDVTEPLHNPTSELALAVLISAIFISWFPLVPAARLGLILALKMNPLFNGQALLVLRRSGRIKQERGELEEHLSFQGNLTEAERRYRWAAVNDSVSGGPEAQWIFMGEC